MSEEELKDIWMNAGEDDEIQLDLPQLVVSLKGKTKELDRTLFFRDLRESAAAVFVMCVFSYKSFTETVTVSKITSALFVIWAGYGIYRLLDVRKHKKAIDLGGSFKNQLLQERNYLKQQSHLSESILSWYVGPFAVIMTIRVLGESYGDPFWVFLSSVSLILVVGLLFSWGVYWLNRKVAKTTYAPLIKNIDRVLLHLDEAA